MFEIRERAGMTDMLIRDQALGRALADALGNHPAALMRGHGAVVVGPSLQRVVGRSIFLALNATLQMQAAALGGPVTYLDPEEARKIEERRRLWPRPGLGSVETQGDGETGRGATPVTLVLEQTMPIYV